MAESNEIVASQPSSGSVLLTALISSVVSGAVSGTVGYFLGARPKSRRAVAQVCIAV